MHFGGAEQCPQSGQNAVAKSVSADGDFLTIFEHLTQRLERDELELLATIAQKVWHRRNRVVFGGVIMPPRRLSNHAKETLEDFRKAQEQQLPYPRENTERQTKWSKPSLGWIKLNWDAAIDRQSNTMEVGLVARDQTGQV
jgi:hypothetical protein